MPYVKLTTTKTLTLQQEVALKKVTGELISIFPNKTEDYLMIHIEDNQVMYFRGKEIECMRIGVELYRQCDTEYKKDEMKGFFQSVWEFVEKIFGGGEMSEETDWPVVRTLYNK